MKKYLRGVKKIIPLRYFLQKNVEKPVSSMLKAVEIC